MIFALFFLCLCIRVHSKSSSCYENDTRLPAASDSHQVIYSKDHNAVYLFGGMNPYTDPIMYYNDTYKWDLNIVDSTFERIGSTPTTPFYSSANAAVLIEHTIFFLGVRDTSSAPYTTQVIHTFNLDDETWDTESTMPEARRYGCTAASSTHIFYADGISGIGVTDQNASIHIYNIAEQSWSSVVLDLSTSYGWNVQYCCVVGDSFYVWGGIVDWPTCTNAMYKLDTSNLQVTQLNMGGIPLTAYGRAVKHDNLVYAVGAFPPSLATTIYAYDFENEPVVAFTMTYPVHEAAAAVIDSKLYLFGGDTTVKVLDVIQICDLPETLEDIDAENAVIVIIVATICSVVVVAAFIACVMWFFCRRRRRTKISTEEKRNEQVQHQDTKSEHDLLITVNEADHSKQAKEAAPETKHSVKKWLENTVDLPQYYGIFMEHGVDELCDVRRLTTMQLERMGIVRVGHQNKIIRCAQQLRENGIDSERSGSAGNGVEGEHRNSRDSLSTDGEQEASTGYL